MRHKEAIESESGIKRNNKLFDQSLENQNQIILPSLKIYHDLSILLISIILIFQSKFEISYSYFISLYIDIIETAFKEVLIQNYYIFFLCQRCTKKYYFLFNHS